MPFNGGMKGGKGKGWDWGVWGLGSGLKFSETRVIPEVISREGRFGVVTGFAITSLNPLLPN